MLDDATDIVDGLHSVNVFPAGNDACRADVHVRAGVLPDVNVSGLRCLRDCSHPTVAIAGPSYRHFEVCGPSSILANAIASNEMHQHKDKDKEVGSTETTLSALLHESMKNLDNTG